MLIVRHHASGWVREIARKDEDSETEATFDPESGTVTVYEGRREFKALERAARRAGLSKQRAREYLPYRMLEVEVAANAVYSWAAHEILARRLQEERPHDPAEYAAAVHHEAQALRYRAHEKLMRAFLDEEVFDGRISTQPANSTPPADLTPGIDACGKREARQSRGSAVPQPMRSLKIETLIPDTGFGHAECLLAT